MYSCALQSHIMYNEKATLEIDTTLQRHYSTCTHVLCSKVTKAYVRMYFVKKLQYMHNESDYRD